MGGQSSVGPEATASWLDQVWLRLDEVLYFRAETSSTEFLAPPLVALGVLGLVTQLVLGARREPGPVRRRSSVVGRRALVRRVRAVHGACDAVAAAVRPGAAGDGDAPGHGTTSPGEAAGYHSVTRFSSGQEGWSPGFVKRLVEPATTRSCSEVHYGTRPSCPADLRHRRRGHRLFDADQNRRTEVAAHPGDLAEPTRAAADSSGAPALPTQARRMRTLSSLTTMRHPFRWSRS